MATQPPLMDEQALLAELLRRKGMLASGGNLRAIPFPSDPAAAPPIAADGSTGTVSPSSAGTTATDDPNNPRPIGIQPDADANGELVDPTTGQKLNDKDASVWWKYILAGGAIAGTALLANAIKGRGGKPNIVTGTVIDDPSARAVSGDIVDGEFTEVSPRRALPAPSTAETVAANRVGQTKRLNDRSGPKAIEERPSRPNWRTAKQLATNKAAARPGTTGSGPPIGLSDSASDLSPEELVRARALARQLMQQRQAGNQVQMRGGSAARRGLPTGSTDEDGLLNIVIDLVRKGKVPPSVLRQIP